ncbi:MAG: biotin--[acetyl-CoA-carboxylase] ligase [Bacteroidetes bacterium]|nr:MAG: biotin--[acetyl-CoA-carboxylase] ligase [Bacteroidota bacterium]
MKFDVLNLQVFSDANYLKACQKLYHNMKWIKLDSTDSTNREAARILARGNTGEEFVITAEYQSDGKGQGLHSWHSNPGENLLMSLVFFPAFLSASHQFQLSRLLSLSLCFFLEEEGLKPSVKWPNDILLGSSKLAGILIENAILGQHLSHSIAGIGLNLNQKAFPKFPRRASSFALQKGCDMPPEKAARRLTDLFSHYYRQLQLGGSASIEKAYHDRLYLRERSANFQINDERCLATITGVNKQGELALQRNGRLEHYGQGEIVFID